MNPLSKHQPFFTSSVTTNAIRNPTSARVSVPSIIAPTTSNSPSAPAYEWRTTLRSTEPYWTSAYTQNISPISALITCLFRLSGWFKSLSSSFLSARTARLLVLAGTDRLDKELMIGQMQGKFQMVVVPGVGHMLQEVCNSICMNSLPSR